MNQKDKLKKPIKCTKMPNLNQKKKYSNSKKSPKYIYLISLNKKIELKNY